MNDDELENTRRGMQMLVTVMLLAVILVVGLLAWSVYG